MKYTQPASALILTAATIALASGCAQTRSWSLNSPGSSVQCAYQDEQPAIVAETESDELVIGTDLAFADIPAYDRPATELTLAEITNELIAMHNLDRQLVRSSIDPSQQDHDAVARVNAIDRAHTDRLVEIVDYIGWPTRGTVGLEATQGAYLVIQHAGHNTAFQSRCLDMMLDLAQRGELPKPYVALLTDRISVFNNQPQIYGTQMTLAKDSNGVMRPVPSSPIGSPEQLDARRAEMGMPAHDKFVTAIAQAYAASLVEPNSRYASVETD